jgi:hypothetical protein
VKRLGFCARVLVTAFAIAGGAWLVAGGCASQSDTVIREHDWKNYTPDGGWSAFAPTHGEYEPGTMQAASGQTSPSPVSATWLEAH